MSVQIPSSIKDFLESSQITARDFQSVRAGQNLIELVHRFWPYQEIVDGLKIKEEWGVEADLIPFYGDWHTLICISSTSGKVSLLDDDRTTSFVWGTSEDFLSDLTHEFPSENEPPQSKPVLIEATYSDELSKLIEEAKRQGDL
ncbi:MAG: SMI1/KNR4 family protein [Pseudomonadota bacterium]